MKISYKPLWKQLIDKDLKKKDLCELAGISPASVTKMGKCGHVTTDMRRTGLPGGGYSGTAARRAGSNAG